MNNKIKDDLLFAGKVLLFLLVIALVNTILIYPLVDEHYSLFESLVGCYYVVAFTSFIYCLMTDIFH